MLSHSFKFGLLEDKNTSIGASVSCSIYELDRSKTLYFPSSAHPTSCYFEMIHSNVWGMYLAASNVHYKYFVTFIDDYNCFI